MLIQIDDVLFPYQSNSADDDHDTGGDSMVGTRYRNKPNFPFHRFLYDRSLIEDPVGVDDDDPNLLVNTPNGRLRGINLDDEHRAWLSIPYAEPPVGKRLSSFPPTRSSAVSPLATQMAPRVKFERKRERPRQREPALQRVQDE